MGEAKRRKQLDPNYGNVRNDTHRWRRGEGGAIFSKDLSPDFGNFLLHRLAESGQRKARLIDVNPNLVMPFHLEEKHSGEFTTFLTISGQEVCATFLFPSENEAETEWISQAFLKYGIACEVYPELELAYLTELDFVVPVCFVDFDAVRSSLKKQSALAHGRDTVEVFIKGNRCIQLC